MVGIESEGIKDSKLGFKTGDISVKDLNPDIGAVIVGMDHDMCYYKISKAVAYLIHGVDVKFISTNPDGSFPDGDVRDLYSQSLKDCY